MSWEIASFANTAGAGIAPGTLSLISPDGTVMSRRHLSDSNPILYQLWAPCQIREHPDIHDCHARTRRCQKAQGAANRSQEITLPLFSLR